MFEGRAPELKRQELAKRSSRREDATVELEAAKEVRRGGRISGGGSGDDCTSAVSRGHARNAAAAAVTVAALSWWCTGHTRCAQLELLLAS